MAAVESIFEVMREVVTAPNPSLVTREEFVELEHRVDRILMMMDDLEEHLTEQAKPKPPAHFYTPPPPRP